METEPSAQSPVTRQRGRFGKYLTVSLTISDFVIINLIFLAVYFINPGVWEGHARVVALLLNVAYLPAVGIMRPVRALRFVATERLLAATFKTLLLDIVIFALLTTYLQTPWPGWAPYAEYYGGMLVIIPLWCMITTLGIRAMRRKGRNYVSVVIVGTHGNAVRLFEEMKMNPDFGYRVRGFFDNNPSPAFPYKAYLLGTVDQLENFVINECIDQVYYTMSGEDEEALRMTLHAAEDGVAQFFMVPRLTRYLGRTFHFARLGPMPLMWLRPIPLASVINRGVKRAFDIAVSGTFLLFSPIIFLPVAIAIKMSSPGPVFFKQKRTGYKGRDFECYKFRTMRVNADADTQQATRDDPRKTRIGDLLRRTSIDELPQFINVFKGDMSVVGPRPHMLTHTEEYSRLINKYMVRHMVRPGITGWAQVNGYRGQTKHLWQMEKRVEYDTWYIENWSFMLDIKIVFNTFLNLFRHEEGAF